MTQLQEIMLAVCFGSVIGAFLGNLISIIVYAVSGCGQMKRRRKTAQEAAEIITNVDLVLAERLHTLVISSILGKPFYGLVYDVKVQELLDYLGMDSHARNINQPFCSEDLTTGIRSVLSAYNEISMHLIERSTLLRMKLGRYFDDLKAKALPR